jgi:MFS family permease
MATGWVFGLSPSFLHDQLGVHITQPAVAGLFAALMVASNGVAQLALRRHHDGETALRVALIGLVAGVALIAASTLLGGLPLALLGAVLAGVGAGVVQMGTMSRVQAMAPDHARGGVTSAFLTGGYVALSVPVVIAGLTADRIGLGPVTGCYLVALAALVAVALFGLHRRGDSPAHVL